MQEITYGQYLERQSLLEQLRNYMAIDMKPEYELGILALLDKVFENFLALGRPTVLHEIQRVTVNRRILGSNSRLKNISLLKYPPADKVARYGRCNIKKHSVLYAAFNYLTVLSELKPEAGDLITISFWENREEIPMQCLSIVGNQPDGSINLNTLQVQQAFELEVKKMPPNLQKLFRSQVDFLADAFSRFIQPGAHLNYIFSAFFAGKVFGDTVRADALIYPSVQQRLSFDNIAITPSAFERTFKLKEAKEMVVLGSPFGDKPTFSGAFSHVVGTAKSAQTDGQLDWVTSSDTGSIAKFEQAFGINLS